MMCSRNLQAREQDVRNFKYLKLAPASDNSNKRTLTDTQEHQFLRFVHRPSYLCRAGS